MAALVASPVAGQSTRAVAVDIGAEDPAVSPDGSRIAVSILGSIFIVPIEGGAATRITSGEGWSDHPAWSPDGRFLAYAHLRPGMERRTELVIRNNATAGSRTLHTTRHTLGQIKYHPEEPTIFFIEDENQFVAHLQSIGVDREGFSRITQGESRAEWSFALSPTGDRVALEHVWRGASDLYLLDPSSGAPEQLTDSPGEEFSVHWTADGESLVYFERIEGIDHLRVRSLATGDISGSFSAPYSGKQLSLHPDGESAVMTHGRRLYRVHLTSGELTPIPFTANFDLPVQSQGDLVIGNARLFDATEAPVRESANVAVSDGRITRVWTGALQASDTTDVEYIDARGRFLMPGLVDSHYHYWHHFTYSVNEMLTKGITTMRDPGSEISETLNFRDALRLGIIEGPDLYTLGPLIDGSAGYHPMVDVLLTDPAAAETLVQSLHDLGVDGIKIYHSLTPDVVRAVAQAARDLGLPVTGDIGCHTQWETVVDAGVTGLNHAYVYRYSYLPDDLTPCRPGEPFQVERARNSVAGFTPIDPDRDEVREVFATMAREGVAFDPTIGYFTRPDSVLASRGLDERIRDTGQLEAYKKLVRIAYEEGVTLLTGTDNLDLHNDLEIYEDAGVPRDVILRAATVNGARWFGEDVDFGTIEPGKRANLLLVEGDPLSQMEHIRQVRLVVKDGRVVFVR